MRKSATGAAGSLATVGQVATTVRPGRCGVALLAALAIALPILNPFAQGPSTQTAPLLFSWLCCAVLLALFRVGWVRVAVWGWLAATLVSSVIALCQYFGLAPHFSPWMSAAEAGEAFANLRQRNQFATLTNIGVAALLWWVRDCWMRDVRTERYKLVAAYLGLALIIMGNAASTSRVGFTQLLLLVVLVGAWKGPFQFKLFKMALFGLAVYVLAAVLLPISLEHFLGIPGRNAFSRMAQQEGCWSRRVLWSNVLHLIVQKPWLGWGWGELDFAHYATLYPGERFCALLDNAHNLPLHLAVELGIPLAAVICGGLCWLTVAAAPWRATRPHHQLAWMILAVILVHSMLEYPLWYGPFQMAAGLSVLFLLPRAPGAGTLTTAGRVPAALALAGCVSFAWWDYARVSQIYRPYEERSAQYRDDTLAKVRGSRIFRTQVLFAELSVTPLTAANASHMVSLARDLLHFSPEQRVIEVLIEGLTMTQQYDEALRHAALYRAAYPDDFAAWSARNRAPP